MVFLLGFVPVVDTSVRLHCRYARAGIILAGNYFRRAKTH